MLAVVINNLEIMARSLTMLRRMVLFAVVTSLTLVLVRTAGAQTASVNGTVTDTTGALVQNATVTATNISRSIQTGASGVYTITDLVAGLYDLKIEKPGFRTVRFAAVTLTVDQALTLNTKLEVGSNAEQVTVEDTSIAPINTTDAQVSNVVDEKQMEALPLILRDPYQLILLTPGTTQT